MNSEIEKIVKAIYCDAWIIYEEYLESYDMAQYNRRVAELKEKYGYEAGFLTNILCSFAPIVYTLHAEHLMVQDGKIKEESC